MPHFEDRREAGKVLGSALGRYRRDRPVVLALPRGGVPVGFEVARSLEAPLDILLVRKIGVPGHEELALGAVVDGSAQQVVINPDVRASVGVRDDYLRGETARLLGEIVRRRRLYLGGREPVAIKGRSVIVVDDGIATGASVTAALRGVRLREPAKVVLAVPVAPAGVLDALKRECDDIVCLTTPDPFHAVSHHYRHFGQMSDEEVMELLAEAMSFERVAPDS